MFVRWKKTPLARGGSRRIGDFESGCHHIHGHDSVALVPIVVQSYRPEGKTPRLRTVWRPGVSIRQCCALELETIHRSVFWETFERSWEHHAKQLAERCRLCDGHAHELEAFVGAREAIFAQVARVVPAVSPDDLDVCRFCYFGFPPVQKPEGMSELDHDRARYRAAVARRDEWHSKRRAGETFDAWWKRRNEPPESPTSEAKRSSSGLPRSAVFGALFVGTAECWTILGLRWRCTAAEVSKAYRALARTHHPDRGGSTEEFCRVTRARDEALKLIEIYGHASAA